MQKKHVIQLGLIAGIAASVMSCTNAQNYANAVNSWQGVSEPALIEHWGHPTEVKALENGNHLDIYRVVERNRSHKVYWDAVPFVRVSPQNSKALVLSHTPDVMHNHEDLFWCETAFEVNKAHIIVNTHFTGNNCEATKSGAQHRTY